MRKALAVEPTTPDVQRLGHLLARVGADEAADALADELGNRRSIWVPLVPGEPTAAELIERDPRWRVVVNAELRAD